MEQEANKNIAYVSFEDIRKWVGLLKKEGINSKGIVLEQLEEKIKEEKTNGN